jgi:hypothetical protein
LLVVDDGTVVAALLNADDAAACKFTEVDAEVVTVDELGAKFKAGE